MCVGIIIMILLNECFCCFVSSAKYSEYELHLKLSDKVSLLCSFRIMDYFLIREVSVSISNDHTVL